MRHRFGRRGLDEELAQSHARAVQPQQIALLRMIGREPEEPALEAFIRGLVLVLVGLGVETYARLFL